MKYDGIDFAGGHFTHSGRFGIKELQIGCSSYITANLTAVPGKKDKRLVCAGERPLRAQIHGASKSPVVIFDTTDRVAWFLDGASLILLLVRAWMSHPDALPALHSCAGEIFKIFHHLDTTIKGRSSAYEVLMHKKNMKLDFGFKDDDVSDCESDEMTCANRDTESESWDYRRLLCHFVNTFEKIQAHSVDLRENPQWNVDIEASKTLHGFCFTDILTTTTVLRSRSVTLGSPAWLRMTEKAGSVNIVGKSFGQLIRSAAGGCEYQATVPCGKDLLVAQLSTLKDVARRNGEINNDSVEIVEGFFWNNPTDSFQRTVCACNSVTKCRRCEPFITFLSNNRGKVLKNHRGTCTNVFELHPSGAIIMGHNKRFWSRPNKLKTADDAIELEDPHPRRSSYASDSAIVMDSPESTSSRPTISSSSNTSDD